jgi:hypothetical protein
MCLDRSRAWMCACRIRRERNSACDGEIRVSLKQLESPVFTGLFFACCAPHLRRWVSTRDDRVLKYAHAFSPKPALQLRRSTAWMQECRIRRERNPACVALATLTATHKFPPCSREPLDCMDAGVPNAPGAQFGLRRRDDSLFHTRKPHPAVGLFFVLDLRGQVGMALTWGLSSRLRYPRSTSCQSLKDPRLRGDDG